MMCTTVHTLLHRSLMPSHGELLQAGLVRVPAETEAVHFVSHEWLSRAHPDPLGAQLRRLQRVFRTGVARGTLDDARRRHQAAFQAQRPTESSFAADVDS